MPHNPCWELVESRSLSVVWQELGWLVARGYVIGRENETWKRSFLAVNDMFTEERVENLLNLQAGQNATKLRKTVTEEET